ncbi:MAG: hypothetical protein MUC35_04340 [Candidatus Margulisbacteria bacterium]|nr:hypothetical protein [Candidatus Margulisiibacteriota bacterium]
MRSFLGSLPQQRWLSPNLTLTIHRFVRQEKRQVAEVIDSLRFFQQLNGAKEQAQRITVDSAKTTPPMLHGVVAVFNPGMGNSICHTATVVNLEPEPQVAYGSINVEGVCLDRVQKYLLEEAARGFSTYLYPPETIDRLLAQNLH